MRTSPFGDSPKLAARNSRTDSHLADASPLVFMLLGMFVMAIGGTHEGGRFGASAWLVIGGARLLPASSLLSPAPWFESAHAAVEAALVEARRRVGINGERGG
jgi:hypothetical protein